MDGGAWWAVVHGVAKRRTRLRDFTFTFPFPALEKEMTTHSSDLAWKIPGTGEPHGLPCMGSHRVRHDWSDLAAADRILKSRDITLPTEIHLVKAMVFPEVMYECESWNIKKSEHQRIDAFDLWCWRRLLRIPWTARRSNWSILKEIRPGCSLEGLMLKLKFQYFGHLMWRADSLEKTLMLGKIEGRKRKGWQRMRWLDGITDSMDIALGGLWELVMDRGPGVLWFMGSERVRQDWATELNWTDVQRKAHKATSLFFRRNFASQMIVDATIKMMKEKEKKNEQTHDHEPSIW